MVSRARFSRHERLGRRYGKVLLAVLAGLVFLGWGLWGWQKLWHLSFPRESLLLVGEPMLVWSWDSRSRRSVFIQIPASTQIEGLFGYGKYSLSALSRLGQMERAGNRLLRQSLSEALAIPIFWDWEEKTMSMSPATTAPRDRIKHVFSLAGIGKYLTGRYATNLSLPTFLRLTRAAGTATLATSTILDLGQAGVLTPEKLPDGTAVFTLDPGRWDFVLGNALADEEIRREQVAIAVYNTTQTPALGTRVARFLGHLGANVVAVGNVEEKVGRCQLIGRSRSLETATADLIVELLDCEKRLKEDVSRAELVILVGTDFEAHFRH